jgi:hypothetical protein
MISKAAPDRARLPRWIMCQSVGRPSTAEYWHIGAMAMRLDSSSEPREYGENSLLMMTPADRESPV